jgi:DNA-binding transcriptional ArsR family regulator
MRKKTLKTAERVFKALSDSSRLRILKMLQVKPMAVCEITSILKLAPSTVSNHLAILRDAGFIEDEKNGKWVIYKLTEDYTEKYVFELAPLFKEWLEDDPLVKEDMKLARIVDRFAICRQ